MLGNGHKTCTVAAAGAQHGTIQYKIQVYTKIITRRTGTVDTQRAK
jgi:hypothetical protein